MKVREIFLPFKADSGVPRSDGLHLSEVLMSYLKELNIEQYPESSDADKQANFEKGFIWERILDEWLSWAFAKQAPFRPDEVKKDGVICSPDGFWNYEGHDCITEYKCTLSSSNKPIEDRVYWKYQMMAYCNVMHVNHAILFVLYLAGNWRPPKTQERTYEITFSEQEITETWDTLIRHAKSKGMMT